MNLLHKYINGNYTVSLYDDGTKVREHEEPPAPIWPESMDVKVTDFCDANCGYCHEKSTIQGQHGCVDTGLKLFADLPAGTEIAIGGGNPLSWGRGLNQFTQKLHTQGVVCNLTVNSIHLRKSWDWLLDATKRKCWGGAVYGVGISYTKAFAKECVEFAKSYPHTVFHVIAGVHTVDEIQAIVERVQNPKILVLGYKVYGRGEKYFSPAVEQVMYDWFTRIHEFFGKKGLILSFDNLAIKQLKLQRFFSKEEWEKFYMGDDGKFTMYVDLVKKEYAKSSTSTVRYQIKDTDTAQSIFKVIRNETL